MRPQARELYKREFELQPSLIKYYGRLIYLSWRSSIYVCMSVYFDDQKPQWILFYVFTVIFTTPLCLYALKI